jgi:hypothetical protein
MAAKLLMATAVIAALAIAALFTIQVFFGGLGLAG